MKLSTVIQGYWLDKKLEFSKQTVQTYSYPFRYLVEYLGDVEFTDITTNHIRHFLIHLQESRNLSRRSLSDYWIALSSLWSWAETELGTPHVIRDKVKRPKYSKKQIEYFTQGEIKSLVSTLDSRAEWTTSTGKSVQAKRSTALRDTAIILTLFDTGIRASELCALVVGDYDPDRGRLHIKHGKGDKARYVVVGNRTQKALWRYLVARPKAKPTDPLFATRGDGHINRNNLRQMLNRIGDNAAVDNVHPHRFRHTFAITFLRNGGNVLLLKELLGHESLQTVLEYVRIAESDIDTGQKYSPADNWKV
ncbi:MAG: tyrosine-type recombinase/integrase [Microbacteriaceae bacterium]|nr:tyrosine-type recombinase/integrase [Microbacteriaceae bacterium]